MAAQIVPTSRSIILNGSHEVTSEITSRIVNNDLDVLFLNYDLEPVQSGDNQTQSNSPFFGLGFNHINFRIVIGPTVTKLFGMFQQCTALEDLPSFNTEKVTDFRNMFKDCPALKRAPKFDCTSAINMQSMFHGCQMLTEVPKLVTPKASVMQDMFTGCYSLTSFALPDTSQVKNMQSMFNGCAAIKQIKNVQRMQKS